MQCHRSKGHLQHRQAFVPWVPAALLHAGRPLLSGTSHSRHLQKPRDDVDLASISSLQGKYPPAESISMVFWGIPYVPGFDPWPPLYFPEGKMEGVGRLWGQHIALNEPLRTQTCKTNLCEPKLAKRTFANPNLQNEQKPFYEHPTRSLWTMAGVCEPDQVSRTTREPKAGGANLGERIFTVPQ